LLVARDRDRLEQLALELRSTYDASVQCEVMDLSELDAAQRLYVASRRHGEQVDLLINNAGFGVFGSFVDLPMRRIQDMLRLHVNTVVETMRLFLPGMVERSQGTIINVASVAGFFALPFMAEYAATKTFLIAFSQAVAEEVRPFGVRIQACCPGSTNTDFHRTAGFQANNPLGSDTPAHVVAVSLGALPRNQVIVTMGWRGTLMWRLSRWLPVQWLTRFAGKWVKARQRSGLHKGD
jgi:short-subunit dehydrogenase